MSNFDIILGMNWLTYFHVMVDRFGKGFILHLEDGSVVNIRGDNFSRLSFNILDVCSRLPKVTIT